MWEMILEESKKIGIHDLAIIHPHRDPSLKELLNRRKEEGRQLSIEEENIALRVDPFLSLPPCQSMFVLFYQIPYELEKGNPSKEMGELASISWGEDYHRILTRQLEELDEFLRGKIGETYQSYFQVDTGPLYERYFAEKTGRGSRGKNGSFIHKDLGSFVAIGLLLTNIEIKKMEEKMLPSLCGRCQKCIENCPGGAISEEGIVDPRKCRSWITQKKEELTVWEEILMGNSLYGCDICQKVCPQNRNIQKRNQEENLIQEISLEEIETLSNRECKKKFGHLSGFWRGPKLWKRNAQIIRKNQNSML
ncbi:tRNA epoxyqueuosine(34) reductase QueG [Peptoniphilus sp. KCTC 25270]|uniref:tRNA epoxyqueuosine(34) reductase QueG n=1 Tax=Peptoniphilus sp. KCTC 25270 TaxID=2897414 RepID=UPI001E299797|nr:tRNA epoxyqueuosine(34) reductase QueG [Peptoniphilus sp. KCTC 25270]MCD1146639.1 tRNA epoxyqueuosine(34) reductase QueG [Peptoniphilus sp. KCTC 25270]